MDNQHRKISGYRELTQQEIDLMNAIKAIGPSLAALVERVRTHVDAQYDAAINNYDEKAGEADIAHLDRVKPYTWIEDAELSLQKGLMSLTRAVAQPESF